MQAVIAIPDLEALRSYGGAEKALTRKVRGMPVLLRTIQAAIEAGVDSLVTMWPSSVPLSIWLNCQASLLREGINGLTVIQPVRFNPRDPVSWGAISSFLEGHFLWLPWNWVTHKGALMTLTSTPALPATWSLPMVIEKKAALGEGQVLASIHHWPEGVPVISNDTARQAARFLTARQDMLPMELWRRCWATLLGRSVRTAAVAGQGAR